MSQERAAQYQPGGSMSDFTPTKAFTASELKMQTDKIAAYLQALPESSLMTASGAGTGIVDVRLEQGDYKGMRK